MISEETTTSVLSGAATPEPSIKKRHLIGLSGKQKMAICIYKEQNPRLIHTEISDHFTMKWKFKVPLSTVSYILKTKNRWLNQSTAKNYIRLKKHQYQKLHNDLYEWFKEKRMQGEQVTDNMLVEQGKRFGEQLGVVDFPYSPRWLRGFKASHGLLNNPVNAQYCTVVEKNGGERQQDEVCGFAYDDIYSFVEMRMAYSMETKMARWDPTSGDISEMIQVFLCTNGTGTDKLEPMVMGRHAVCLSSDEEDCAIYKSIKDDLQVDAIVQEWLQNVSLQMHLNGRHILLLFHTDRCCQNNISFSNVEIMFVPPSDAFQTHLNIAEIFKSHYGNFLLEHFQPTGKFSSNTRDFRVTLQDVLKLVKVSWDSISEDTIRECWNNTGLKVFQKCWKKNHESSNCSSSSETAASISEDSCSLTGGVQCSASVEQVRTAFSIAMHYFQQDASHKLASHLEHLRKAQQDMETIVSASAPSKYAFKSLFDLKKD